MANVFGILTLIVLGLSAFIALKNKDAYQKELDSTAAAKEALVKTEVTLKDRKETLAALPPAIAIVDAKVAELSKEEATLQKANGELKSQNEGKSEKIASNKAKLDDIRQKTEKTGDIKELASKMRTINSELEELGQSIDTATAKLASLTGQYNQSETQVNASKADFAKFSAGESLPTVNTRIRSIYPTWGFVTLGSGNNAGIVANSTLDVIRDEQVIAKLVVTAVESTTATASIIPDSMAQDVTLMAGDRVVPGLKATKIP